MGRILCLTGPMFVLFVSSAVLVEGDQDCSSCSQLEIGVAVGFITGDILLTLLIALSVYWFVSHQKRTGSSHPQTRCCSPSKASTLQPSMRLKTTEEESPYQELYGVQSDIYSDLQQYRK
ncbi:TYRO protein tyrosine kinase-binding protein [Triplophysa dalaica]|uniref:TYRO protein tyrosine kinase-binding protein n=1 Tax=Triplophysa dalaica TaxID=1582913 RepID=UPI0024DF4C76|nr:TYRO protein tyrosine kinase-binding protein [Triplophysa dalaica]